MKSRSGVFLFEVFFITIFGENLIVPCTRLHVKVNLVLSIYRVLEVQLNQIAACNKLDAVKMVSQNLQIISFYPHSFRERFCWAYFSNVYFL